MVDENEFSNLKSAVERHDVEITHLKLHTAAIVKGVEEIRKQQSRDSMEHGRKLNELSMNIVQTNNKVIQEMRDILDKKTILCNGHFEDLHNKTNWCTNKIYWLLAMVAGLGAALGYLFYKG